MTSINKLIEENPDVRIDVYACAFGRSERMLKSCKGFNVTLIEKPCNFEKLAHLINLYKQWDVNKPVYLNAGWTGKVLKIRA